MSRPALTVSAGGELLSLLYSTAGADLPREWLVWLARFAARLDEAGARVRVDCGEREAQG